VGRKHGSQTPSRDALKERNGAQHPSLRVRQCFFHLVKFVATILDSCVVFDDLLVLAHHTFNFGASLTLMTAIFRSLSDKNHAVMGEVGIKKKRKMPHPIVRGPKIRKTICSIRTISANQPAAIINRLPAK